MASGGRNKHLPPPRVFFLERTKTLVQLNVIPFSIPIHPDQVIGDGHTLQVQQPLDDL